MVQIVLVELEKMPATKAVYEAPGLSVTAGDYVDTGDTGKGRVISVLTSRPDYPEYRFLSAAFGLPDLPKLKGRIIYKAFHYDEEEKAS